MDQLPDEIVLIILKDAFNCPSDILHCLSLVCKHWQGLCQDSYLWTEVEISLTEQLSLEAYKRLATTLMKAPSLRKLTVKCNNEHSHKDILIKCLQRCTDSPKKIQQICLETCSPEVLYHLATVLIQYALDGLQVLRLKLTQSNPFDQECLFGIDGHDDSILEFILHLQGLQELDLSLSDRFCSYKSPQSWCRPPLKNLSIQSLCEEPCMSLGAFARDIMTATSETLESLELKLRSDTRNPIPDLPFPNLSSINFGYFVDDPPNIQVMNTPNLKNICLGWDLKSTDSGDFINRLRALVHKFRCISPYCDVLVFAYVPLEVFSLEEEIKLFLSSLPNYIKIVLFSYAQ